MKKISKTIVIALLLIALPFLFAFSPVSAESEQPSHIPVVPELPYAQILDGDAILWQRNGEEMLPIVQLPPTFFVQILSDEDDSYFFVRYDELEGYIHKDAVEKVDYEPVTKFWTGSLTLSFDVAASFIRSRPSHLENNIIGTAQGNYQFFGPVDGTAPTNQGFVWHLIRFTPEDGEKTFGYIFSAQTTTPKPPVNTVEWVMVENPAYSPNTTSPQNPSPRLTPLTTTIIIIVSLCVPALLVAVLIFKKPRAKKQGKKNIS